jgi:hypothetical protein
VTLRARGRLGAAALAGLAVAGTPAAVSAHSLDATYQSRLPLAIYLAGAGITVALSFAFVLLRDLRAEPPPADAEAKLPPAALRVALRAVGLVGWLWIVVQGIVGGSGAGDVGSLFVWVYTWVGIAIVSAVVFPAWHWIDPFSTLYDLGSGALRRLGVGDGWELAPYPGWLGRWPAVAAFAFIVWLELVLKGAEGQTLFISVVGYTAYTLAMMAQFGRDAWRANGDVFSVWFRLLNRLAPFALANEDGRLRRRPFAAGLLEGGWRRADVVLIALATAAILFDGLTQTTPWYDVFGAPAAPGLTLQLVAFLAVVVAAALVVSRLVGVASTGAGLLPIALGYLIAHYLTYLLIDGQRIVIALSDPFQRGWDLFGTAFHSPSGSFLEPGFVWTIQLVAVVGGHMLGAWGGHVAAARDAGDAGRDPKDVRLRQVPLAVIMVALTTLTLWSLGQALVVTPETAVLPEVAQPG